MVPIQSITDAAAILYRRGVKFKIAVESALDQYQIKDPFERGVLYRKVCSELGKRGGRKKKKSKPRQLSIRFSFPVKREEAGRKSG